MIGRWYIDAFIDRANVANYSLMTSLAYLPVNAIISIFGGFFVPRIYLKEKENSGYISKANSKIQLISTALWFFIIVFSFYFGDFIIKVFLSKKYLEVSWSLPLLMIGNAIYCIGQLSIYEVYFYKKPKLLIASNVVPGLISLSAGFFLIKYYGYLGAVASNLIAFASSGIITFYVTQKFSKKRAYAY
jgi:O-antigen/teichoic acid export membrane protein